MGNILDMHELKSRNGDYYIRFDKYLFIEDAICFKCANSEPIVRGIIFNANVYLASISVGKTTYIFEMLVPPVAFVFYVFVSCVLKRFPRTSCPKLM